MDILHGSSPLLIQVKLNMADIVRLRGRRYRLTYAGCPYTSPPSFAVAGVLQPPEPTIQIDAFLLLSVFFTSLN